MQYPRSWATSERRNSSATGKTEQTHGPVDSRRTDRRNTLGTGNLSSLETLNLDGNLLSGEIPQEMALLKNLNSLYLGDNQLSGDIPRDLALLDSLINLDISNNRLTGDLPFEFTRLQNLKGLRINGNQLTGCIPPLLSSRLARDRIGQVDKERSNLGGLPSC